MMTAAMGKIAVQTDDVRNLPSYGDAPICMPSGSGYGCLEENICLPYNRLSFVRVRLKPSTVKKIEGTVNQTINKHPINIIASPPQGEK